MGKNRERSTAGLLEQCPLPCLTLELSAASGPHCRFWPRHRSEHLGFEPYRPREVSLSGDALRAAEDSRPHYERLHEARVVL